MWVKHVVMMIVLPAFWRVCASTEYSCKIPMAIHDCTHQEGGVTSTSMSFVNVIESFSRESQTLTRAYTRIQHGINHHNYWIRNTCMA